MHGGKLFFLFENCYVHFLVKRRGNVGLNQRTSQFYIFQNFSKFIFCIIYQIYLFVRGATTHTYFPSSVSAPARQCFYVCRLIYPSRNSGEGTGVSPPTGWWSLHQCVLQLPICCQLCTDGCCHYSSHRTGAIQTVTQPLQSTTKTITSSSLVSRSLKIG